MNKTIIIAEGGINHNGDFSLCRNLIDIASNAGCDIFKLQKRSVKHCFSREELLKTRETPWGIMTNEKWKNKLEFSEDEYNQINQYCKEKNIGFMVSPWDLPSVEFLRNLDLKYNKIPSARLGHLELLETVASQGKYTFISTGMATLEEIEKAVNIFRKNKCQFELMHCNSQYPMPDSEANLLMIRTLKHTFDCKVGYSDHAPGLITSLVAVTLGATSLEKHITLNRTMYGSDQSASVEPNGLRKLVEWIRVIPETLGNGKKIITEEEWVCRNKLWKTEDING